MASTPRTGRNGGIARLRCPETGFPGRRKMRQCVARTTDQRSQRLSGRTTSPPIRGLSHLLQEISATEGMRGGGCSPHRTGLRVQFPSYFSFYLSYFSEWGTFLNLVVRGGQSSSCI